MRNGLRVLVVFLLAEAFAASILFAEPFAVPASTEAENPRSVGGAFFRSLLLPGWGQHYAGADRASRLFLAAEAALWLGYVGFVSYGDWREQDYRAFAAAHAGVDLEGKNSTYFINIGNFDSIFDYNEYRLRQRNTKDYYYDVEAFFWQWESPAQRRRYTDLRISADTARNRALFVLGGVVANHLISAVEAVWEVRRRSNETPTSLSWDVRVGDGRFQPYLQLSLTKRF